MVHSLTHSLTELNNLIRRPHAAFVQETKPAPFPSSDPPVDPDVNVARFQNANLAFLIESEVMEPNGSSGGRGGLDEDEEGGQKPDPVLADHMIAPLFGNAVDSEVPNVSPVTNGGPRENGAPSFGQRIESDQPRAQDQDGNEGEYYYYYYEDQDYDEYDYDEYDYAAEPTTGNGARPTPTDDNSGAKKVKMLPVPDHMMAPMFENNVAVDMPLLEFPPPVSKGNLVSVPKHSAVPKVGPAVPELVAESDGRPDEADDDREDDQEYDEYYDGDDYYYNYYYSDENDDQPKISDIPASPVDKDTTECVVGTTCERGQIDVPDILVAALRGALESVQAGESDLSSAFTHELHNLGSSLLRAMSALPDAELERALTEAVGQLIVTSSDDGLLRLLLGDLQSAMSTSGAPKSAALEAAQVARQSRQIDPELSDALLRAIKDAITYSGDKAEIVPADLEENLSSLGPETLQEIASLPEAMLSRTLQNSIAELGDLGLGSDVDTNFVRSIVQDTLQNQVQVPEPPPPPPTLPSYDQAVDSVPQEAQAVFPGAFGQKRAFDQNEIRILQEEGEPDYYYYYYYDDDEEEDCDDCENFGPGEKPNFLPESETDNTIIESQPLNTLPVLDHMITTELENSGDVLPLSAQVTHIKPSTTKESSQEDPLVSQPLKMLPVPDHMMAPMFENGEKVNMPLLKFPPQVPLVPDSIRTPKNLSSNDERNSTEDVVIKPLKMLPVPDHMIAPMFENEDEFDMPLLKFPPPVPLVLNSGESPELVSNDNDFGGEEKLSTEESILVEELVSQSLKMLPAPDHMMAPMFENVDEVDMPLLIFPPPVPLVESLKFESKKDTFGDRKERNSTPTKDSLFTFGQTEGFKDMLCHDNIHNPDDLLQTLQCVSLFSNLAFDKVLGDLLKPTFCLVTHVSSHFDLGSSMEEFLCLSKSQDFQKQTENESPPPENKGPDNFFDVRDSPIISTIKTTGHMGGKPNVNKMAHQKPRAENIVSPSLVHILSIKNNISEAGNADKPNLSAEVDSSFGAMLMGKSMAKQHPNGQEGEPMRNKPKQDEGFQKINSVSMECISEMTDLTDGTATVKFENKRCFPELRAQDLVPGLLPKVKKSVCLPRGASISQTNIDSSIASAIQILCFQAHANVTASTETSRRIAEKKTCFTDTQLNLNNLHVENLLCLNLGLSSSFINLSPYAVKRSSCIPDSVLRNIQGQLPLAIPDLEESLCFVRGNIGPQSLQLLPQMKKCQSSRNRIEDSICYPYDELDAKFQHASNLANRICEVEGDKFDMFGCLSSEKDITLISSHGIAVHIPAFKMESKLCVNTQSNDKDRVKLSTKLCINGLDSTTDGYGDFPTSLNLEFCMMEYDFEHGMTFMNLVPLLSESMCFSEDHHSETTEAPPNLEILKSMPTARRCFYEKSEEERMCFSRPASLEMIKIRKNVMPGNYETLPCLTQPTEHESASNKIYATEELLCHGMRLIDEPAAADAVLPQSSEKQRGFRKNTLGQTAQDGKNLSEDDLPTIDSFNGGKSMPKKKSHYICFDRDGSDQSEKRTCFDDLNMLIQDAQEEVEFLTCIAHSVTIEGMNKEYIPSEKRLCSSLPNYPATERLTHLPISDNSGTPPNGDIYLDTKVTKCLGMVYLNGFSMPTMKVRSCIANFSQLNDIIQRGVFDRREFEILTCENDATHVSETKLLQQICLDPTLSVKLNKSSPSIKTEKITDLLANVIQTSLLSGLRNGFSPEDGMSPKFRSNFQQEIEEQLLQFDAEYLKEIQNLSGADMTFITGKVIENIFETQRGYDLDIFVGDFQESFLKVTLVADLTSKLSQLKLFDSAATTLSTNLEGIVRNVIKNTLDRVANMSDGNTNGFLLRDNIREQLQKQLLHEDRLTLMQIVTLNQTQLGNIFSKALSEYETSNEEAVMIKSTRTDDEDLMKSLETLLQNSPGAMAHSIMTALETQLRLLDTEELTSLLRLNSHDINQTLKGITESQDVGKKDIVDDDLIVARKVIQPLIQQSLKKLSASKFKYDDLPADEVTQIVLKELGNHLTQVDAHILRVFSLIDKHELANLFRSLLKSMSDSYHSNSTEVVESAVRTVMSGFIQSNASLHFVDHQKLFSMLAREIKSNAEGLPESIVKKIDDLTLEEFRDLLSAAFKQNQGGKLNRESLQEVLQSVVKELVRSFGMQSENFQKDSLHVQISTSISEEYTQMMRGEMLEEILIEVLDMQGEDLNSTYFSEELQARLKDLDSSTLEKLSKLNKTEYGIILIDALQAVEQQSTPGRENNTTKLFDLHVTKTFDEHVKQALRKVYKKVLATNTSSLDNDELHRLFLSELRSELFMLDSAILQTAALDLRQQRDQGRGEQKRPNEDLTLGSPSSPVAPTPHPETREYPRDPANLGSNTLKIRPKERDRATVRFSMLRNTSRKPYLTSRQKTSPPFSSQHFTPRPHTHFSPTAFSKHESEAPSAARSGALSSTITFKTGDAAFVSTKPSTILSDSLSSTKMSTSDVVAIEASELSVTSSPLLLSPEETSAKAVLQNGLNPKYSLADPSKRKCARLLLFQMNNQFIPKRVTVENLARMIKKSLGSLDMKSKSELLNSTEDELHEILSWVMHNLSHEFDRGYLLGVARILQRSRNITSQPILTTQLHMSMKVEEIKEESTTETSKTNTTPTPSLASTKPTMATTTIVSTTKLSTPTVTKATPTKTAPIAPTLPEEEEPLIIEAVPYKPDGESTAKKEMFFKSVKDELEANTYICVNEAGGGVHARHCFNPDQNVPVGAQTEEVECALKNDPFMPPTTRLRCIVEDTFADSSDDDDDFPPLPSNVSLVDLTCLPRRSGVPRNRKCLADRRDRVPDHFPTEDLMCLRKAYADPREAPLSTETPRTRRCLVLAGEARLSGRRLPPQVEAVVRRVVGNAAEDAKEMSDSEAADYFEAELRRELSKLDADVLDELRGGGREGRPADFGGDGLIDEITKDFERILHRRFKDPVIRELKKRVKRKVLSNLSSIYWQKKFR